MPELSLDGFLTKQEIHDRYGRHRRTLTEDVRKALVQHDGELLSLVRVHTQDGRIREGTELSAGSLKQWTSQRLNPTVYLHPDFVEKVMQRKNKSSNRTKEDSSATPTGHKTQQAQTDPASALGYAPKLPDDPEIRRIVLEHLHFNDRRHREEINELTDRVLQVVETNQQLQGQTNQLMNQFQEVLQEGGGLQKMIAAASVQPTPSRQPSPNQADKPATPPASVIEVTDTARKPKQSPKRKTARPKRKPTPRKKAPQAKPTARKKQRAKKKSIWQRDIRKLFRF